MSSNLQLVSLEDVKAAHDIIRPNIHQTPVISSASITKLTSHQSVVFKCENLQQTGSFKVRDPVAGDQLVEPTHSRFCHTQLWESWPGKSLLPMRSIASSIVSSSPSLAWKQRYCIRNIYRCSPPAGRK